MIINNISDLMLWMLLFRQLDMFGVIAFQRVGILSPNPGNFLKDPFTTINVQPGFGVIVIQIKLCNKESEKIIWI
jgi:hypothetical protein